MRVVIQKNTTESYLKPEGEWGQNLAEAQAFKSGYDALEYCFARELRDVRLRFCFDDSRFDTFVEIPVLAQDQAAVPR